jgi:NAD-dependent deacetylase
MNIDDAINVAAQRIGIAGSTSVLTGAGVSAASGVPTFRGTEGLWKNFAPEKLATPEAFQRDPKLVWEWYIWRRARIAKCFPNAAHAVLATWSRRYPRFLLITQNVDGLHERAGTANMIRFHGSIWEVQCWQNCPQSPERWWDENLSYPSLPPECPYCHGCLRPGVVWFGEGIDPEVLERSQEAASCDLFLSVGTSAVVYPAAGMIAEAHRQGAFTVEINPEATPSSHAVDLAIRGPAEEVLPAIEAHLQGK